MLSSACFLSLPAVLRGAPLTLHSGKGVLWGFHLPRVQPEWQLLLTLLCVQRWIPLLPSIASFLLELSLAPCPSTCKSLHGFPAVNQWPPLNPHPACPAAALATLHFPFLLETLFPWPSCCCFSLLAFPHSLSCPPSPVFSLKS